MCKGEQETTFTCVLDSNISSNNVQWYGLIKDTGTTVMVDPDDDHTPLFTHTGNTLIISLTVTNARQYAGYYWIRLPTDDVCNVSLTVLDAESMYSMLIEVVVIVCISIYILNDRISESDASESQLNMHTTERLQSLLFRNQGSRVVRPRLYAHLHWCNVIIVLPMHLSQLFSNKAYYKVCFKV